MPPRASPRWRAFRGRRWSRSGLAAAAPRALGAALVRAVAHEAVGRGGRPADCAHRHGDPLPLSALAARRLQWECRVTPCIPKPRPNRGHNIGRLPALPTCRLCAGGAHLCNTILAGSPPPSLPRQKKRAGMGRRSGDPRGRRRGTVTCPPCSCWRHPTPSAAPAFWRTLRGWPCFCG